MDFLKEIVKEIGYDFTHLASDIDETETYVDTGSYIFNGLISGSIFGGVSNNKITAIAGESSTGKTFFSLAVVKNFLDSNPDSYCLYFDTEEFKHRIDEEEPEYKPWSQSKNSKTDYNPSYYQ